jgi:hypothetical protein
VTGIEGSAAASSARASTELLRDQLCAIVYQLMMARTYADVINDLLSTGDETDRLYAVERLDWLRSWLVREFVDVDAASAEFKRSVLPTSVQRFVDTAAADDHGRAVATRALPRT